MKNQNIQQNTLFRIKPDGTGCYVVNDEEISRKDYERMFPVIRIRMKQNCDRRKLWIADEIVNEF